MTGLVLTNERSCTVQKLKWQATNQNSKIYCECINDQISSHVQTEKFLRLLSVIVDCLGFNVYFRSGRI